MKNMLDNVVAILFIVVTSFLVIFIMRISLFITKKLTERKERKRKEQ